MRSHVRAVLALLLVLALTLPARADQGLQLIEQEIKAGLLYNFLKYTDWPPGAGNPQALVVCVYRGDPFGGHLKPMAGRTVSQHVIEVRNVNAPGEINVCSLLFVNADEKALWPQLQRELAGKSILTVSDFEGFAKSGGMIEFTRTDNRIGVEVNLDAVTAAHLQVGDRLLKLANAMRTAPTER